MRTVLVLSAWLAAAGMLSSAEEPARPYGYGPLPRGARACLGSPRFVIDKVGRSVAFSPDGKLLALGAGDYGAGGCPIHLWDLKSGQEVHRLSGHTAQVVALRFTPDARELISAAWDNTIRVWSTASGKEVRRIGNHEGVLTGLEMTADGKQLVSSSQDGTIRVWDFASGKELRQMKCWAYGISLAPDGRTLAAASGAVLLWDIQTGRQIGQFGKPDGPGIQGPHGVKFSPDGKSLAVLDGRWKVSLWDLGTRKERLRLSGLKRGAAAMAFSPDGKVLATAGGGYEELGPAYKNFLAELKLWDVATGRLVHACEGHTYYVMDVTFSPDGRSLASAGQDFCARLWDAQTGRESPRFAGHSQAVNGLVFSRDGSTLCSAGSDGTVRLWDPAGGKERAILRGHEKAVMAIALAPGGKVLASGSLDGTVRLWDVESRREKSVLADNHGDLWCLAFSPDGRLLATGDRGNGGAGGTLRLWDWRAGKELLRPEDQQGAHCVAFSRDGKTLAVGHHPHIYVRDVSTGKLLQHLQVAHGEFVRSLGYLPDGTLVSAGTGDRVLEHTVRLWDVKGPTRLHQFGSGEGYHTTMAISDDSRLIAGAFETMILVWETSTRREVARFQGQRGYVGALAFSPDGRTLASGAADGAVVLWDLTGQRKDGRFVRRVLGQAELTAAWKDLAEGARGREAMWQLALAPEQAVPFLRQQLSPAPKADPERLRKLIADLDSSKFAVREKASRELEELGEAAGAALEQVLKEKPSLELAARVRRLLELLETARTEEQKNPPPILRLLRAVEALERAETPEARQLLRDLAAGAPTARLTREASTALERLASRPE